MGTILVEYVFVRMDSKLAHGMRQYNRIYTCIHVHCTLKWTIYTYMYMYMYNVHVHCISLIHTVVVWSVISEKRTSLNARKYPTHTESDLRFSKCYI